MRNKTCTCFNRSVFFLVWLLLHMCDYIYWFFLNQITEVTVWHVINFFPNICWQKQIAAVFGSVCPSVPSDAQPSFTTPAPNHQPPKGLFCWWQGCLYLLISLQHCSLTQGLLVICGWEMQSQEKWKPRRNKSAHLERRKKLLPDTWQVKHEGLLWHFVLST